MTYQERYKICNEVANWYADTIGVDYFEGADAAFVQAHYKEYLNDARTNFPELKKFFKI